MLESWTSYQNIKNKKLCLQISMICFLWNAQQLHLIMLNTNQVHFITIYCTLLRYCMFFIFTRLLCSVNSLIKCILHKKTLKHSFFHVFYSYSNNSTLDNSNLFQFPLKVLSYWGLTLVELIFFLWFVIVSSLDW